jgi:hypothetical protein
MNAGRVRQDEFALPGIFIRLLHGIGGVGSTIPGEINRVAFEIRFATRLPTLGMWGRLICGS